MAWVKIASGTSPDNLQSVTDIQELTKGTEFRIDITTDYLPFGPLADSVGAEFAASLLYQGAEITDVSGPAWNKVRVECVADPIPIWGIILAFAALGVWAYMITKIDIWANILEPAAEMAKWVAISIIAVCGIVLVSRLPARR